MLTPKVIRYGIYLPFPRVTLGACLYLFLTRIGFSTLPTLVALGRIVLTHTIGAFGAVP